MYICLLQEESPLRVVAQKLKLCEYESTLIVHKSCIFDFPNRLLLIRERAE